MEPRLNIVTLGVKNLDRSIHFYKDGLDWSLSRISGGDFAIFKMSTRTALALYPRQMLLKDACLEDCGGFAGTTLAQNVSSKEEVDRILSQAVEAGGSLLKAARDTEWGGYSGYFADPNGHPWEVACTQLLELQQGKLVLPD